MFYIIVRYVLELKKTLVIYVKEISIFSNTFDQEVTNKNYLLFDE
jgi:hypothetical protein